VGVANVDSIENASVVRQIAYKGAMKTPKRIQPLVDMGLVDEVVRPLMSGKEADVFVVRCGDELRCAKVYKDALKRSFKKAVLYREGRKVRNSRRARAMEKSSKFGRQQQEDIWQTAEVDALYRLADAGVRVPKAYSCFGGVLLMELVIDAHGEVAPRLSDVSMTAEEALVSHAEMIRYIVRMLCAGLVHGDLSEFNVLVGQHGPVIIDLPQAVDAAANNQAGWMLVRDVNTITNYHALYASNLRDTRYGEEIWGHYEDGSLHTEIKLTGCIEEHSEAPDVDGVLQEIEAVVAEEQERQERLRQPDADPPNPS
jgi:RIO kinase 1